MILLDVVSVFVMNFLTNMEIQQLENVLVFAIFLFMLMMSHNNAKLIAPLLLIDLWTIPQEDVCRLVPPFLILSGTKILDIVSTTVP